MMDIIFRLV